jgi:prophage regulatory protein
MYQDSSLPLPANGFMRLEHILQLVPVSRSTLYNKRQAKQFPKPIKFGRTSFWSCEAVKAWIEELINTQSNEQANG